MAVGKITIPKMQPIQGVRLSAVQAGIRYEGRDDLALIELCEGTVAGACFTQNLYQAAPVLVGKGHIAKTAPRYLLINSGNANACTGDRGMEDALESCRQVAAQSGVETEEVLPFSTGVIGEHMNMNALSTAVPMAIEQLSDNSWESAARAIMTTDTFPKLVSRELDIAGKKIRVNGIAKGAGMIRPDMATMLAYVFTDANVSAEIIQSICKTATEASFNRVTVDGDTSTNDSVVLAATCKAGNARIDSLETAEGQLLQNALIEVFQQLAQLLVRDGEGATKFVTIEVNGGASTQECLQMGYCIAHSPLVKTALYASDPNWGRLVAAIGRSGVAGLDANKVRVWLDDILLVEKGGVAEDYTEAQGQAVFDKSEFMIRVNMGMGACSEQIWTCDLSHEYVSINADYRS